MKSYLHFNIENAISLGGDVDDYLDDDDEADTSSNVRRGTIHSCHYIDNSLAKGDDQSKHWNKCNEDFKTDIISDLNHKTFNKSLKIN